jgi:hypothetical protein
MRLRRKVPRQRKQCIKCGKDKPIDAFNRVHRGRPERSARCKVCEKSRIGIPVKAQRRAICRECFGLPHRVEGTACPRCGLGFDAAAGSR